jgi:hypothetical protein
MATATKKLKVKVSYKYRDGFRARVPAEVAGARLADLKIQHGRFVTDEEVVDDARREDSPLHPCFEWDDSKAADIHRRGQARNLINSVVEVRIREGEPPREFIMNVHVTHPEKGSCYTSTVEAMGDDVYRVQIVEEAEKLLRGIVGRFRGIPGLRVLMQDALDRACAG